jgi:DNA-binding GntR family transcriptional regulator
MYSSKTTNNLFFEKVKKDVIMMNSIQTTPLQRNIPLYQQVYQEIKNAILTGKIVPGSKINENMLTERFQISRTPIREAIRQLQQEGLVISDGVSISIVELKSKDFEELCHCRLILEKEILIQSIGKITDRDIDILEQLMNQAERELKSESDIDYLQVLKYNSDFHDHYINCCGIKRLVQLLSQTRSLLLLYRANALLKAANNLDIINEHRKILEAMRERDIKKAIEAIETHLKGDFERGNQF